MAASQQQTDLKDRSRQHLKAFPDDPDACFLAAELAMREFDHITAIEYFRRLPEDQGHWHLERELGIAKCCRTQGRMLDEERHLRLVLQLNPIHSDANHRLGHLLQVQGRSWESSEPLMMQIRLGKCRGDELMAVAASDRHFRKDDEYERRSIASAPGQSEIALLAKARTLIFENRNEEAEQLLRQILSAVPSLGEAQGRLGRMIVERGSLDEFVEWRGSLTDIARNHPEVWFVHGLQARRIGQTEGAVHCFLKAIELSPSHLPSNVQIASCLESLGQSKVAEIFEQRVALLSDLESMLTILRSDINIGVMKKASDRLAELGRYWEAAGWLHVAQQLDFPGEAVPMNNQWAMLAIRNPDQNAVLRQQIVSLDIKSFPEPNWQKLISEKNPDQSVKQSTLADAVNWEFVDDATKAGIDFQYFEGTTEETRLQHIFNVVGGGIAAFDFDLDRWPDLHLAQGNDWRAGSDQPIILDRLYRNRRGVYFQDITQVSGITEPGFSHGVCAADYDQDGFPDVYVSNLGANRLFRNNGDGTFDDVTEVAGVAGDEWSITSVLADFSGDGLPDLYVGNYSQVVETTNKICHYPSGEQMACTPDTLTAASDRLYLSLGDGGFQDMTDVAGVRESSGRALALIVWDFTSNGRPSLFVANDTSANFLLHNVRTNSEGVPEFSEEGVLHGVAFDGDGNAQASMGVAAGDANGDGRIDMFVTNFENESNTFYSQGADGSFFDSTRRFRLRDSGFGMLGFGTQFADLDGDGWDDLVAVNGHVDKGRAPGFSDRMPPQLFQNLRGESFLDASAEIKGTFFKKKYLGRALATLDWNRDGRIDFSVSHIHSPFSLVTNQTSTTSHAVSVRLISRAGMRNAVGARIRARIGGRDHFRMATAGGGYLTTNDDTFYFYVPEGEAIQELEVVWPSGRVQAWTTPPSMKGLVLVEDRMTPYREGDI